MGMGTEFNLDLFQPKWRLFSTKMAGGSWAENARVETRLILLILYYMYVYIVPLSGLHNCIVP